MNERSERIVDLIPVACTGGILALLIAREELQIYAGLGDKDAAFALGRGHERKVGAHRRSDPRRVHGWHPCSTDCARGAADLRWSRRQGRGVRVGEGT